MQEDLELRLMVIFVWGLLNVWCVYVLKYNVENMRKNKMKCWNVEYAGFKQPIVPVCWHINPVLHVQIIKSIVIVVFHFPDPNNVNIFAVKSFVLIVKIKDQSITSVIIVNLD